MTRPILTNDPKDKAIAGHAYAYVKLQGYGKMKCAGMVADNLRQFYADHFAGKQEHKPRCPMNVEQGQKAVLMYSPEYVGDQIAAEDLQPVALARYIGGKLIGNPA